MQPPDNALPEDLPPPNHVISEDDPRLEELLLSRIDDQEGDITVTDEFWREFDEQVAKRRQSGK